MKVHKHDSLMAHHFTQQHFPGFSPTAPIVILPQTLMPQMGVETGVPLGGTMSVQMPKCVKLGCIRSKAAITMVFIAMFKDKMW